MKFLTQKLGSLLFFALLLVNCKTLEKGWEELNFFPVSQDIALGKEVSAEINANQKEYPILPESTNPAAYAYVRKIMNTIKSSGAVENATKFKWELKLIKDDKVLNAFCAPGGYIYVYTGLIKYLDSEDQLAGVMGHEMAHAAERHSTRQLTKLMGVQVLVEMGDYFLGRKVKDQRYRELTKQMTATLISLKFSRDHETEADEKSVRYLCGTSYNAAGAAGFFKKIQTKGGAQPEFMSTHPNPGNRVKAIEASAATCKGRNTNTAEYQRIKNTL